MKLHLIRNTYTDRSTIGALSVDSVHVCDILEDMTRQPGIKIYGKTAIPSGAYKVIIDFSNRFKKMLPLLIKVPGYEGVRIHTGNDENNTEGCLLVGTASKQADWVSGSVIAMSKLMTLLEKGVREPGGVIIVIEDTFNIDKRTETAKKLK